MAGCRTRGTRSQQKQIGREAAEAGRYPACASPGACAAACGANRYLGGTCVWPQLFASGNSPQRACTACRACSASGCHPPLAGSSRSQWQRSVLPPGARGHPLPQTHRRLAFFFSQVSCPPFPPPSSPSPSSRPLSPPFPFPFSRASFFSRHSLNLRPFRLPSLFPGPFHSFGFHIQGLSIFSLGRLRYLY